MTDLQRLETSNGPIYIIQRSAAKFQEIGTSLLNDRGETKVGNIAASVRGNQENAIREIYKRWREEDVNHSWTKLTQCLRRCELNFLASEIEQHFGLPSPEGMNYCVFIYTI